MGIWKACEVFCCWIEHSVTLELTNWCSVLYLWWSFCLRLLWKGVLKSSTVTIIVLFFSFIYFWFMYFETLICCIHIGLLCVFCFLTFLLLCNVLLWPWSFSWSFYLIAISAFFWLMFMWYFFLPTYLYFEVVSYRKHIIDSYF